MKSFFASLFIGGLFSEHERSWKDTLVFFIPVLLAFLIIDYEYLTSITSPMSREGLERASIERAYENIFCGKKSHYNHFLFNDEVYSSQTTLLNMPRLDKPINTLFSETDSPETPNCKNSTFLILNENSLSNLYSLIFKIFPSITLQEVSDIFKYVKLLCIIMFAFLLFKIGLSPIYILLASIFSHFLTYTVDISFRFSSYSFFIPNYLFLISLSILYLYGLRKYNYKFIPFGLLLGAYAAYYADFRTSHSIVLFYTLFLLTMTIFYIKIKTFSSKIKTSFFAFLCFFSLYLGFKSYTYIIINPILQEAQLKENSYNSYTYHAVAHPLVLALGLVKSDLATREEIKWSDAVGPILANRIDPSVTYGDKNYEKALFTYYLKLWIYYPMEVYQIYKDKFLTCTSLLFPYFVSFDVSNDVNNPGLKDYSNVNTVEKHTLLNRKILNIAALIYSYLNSPWKFLLIIFSSFMLVGRFYKKFNPIGLFLSFSILGASLLLYLESAIIMNEIVIRYHSLLNLLFLFVLLYYFQIIGNLFYKAYTRTKWLRSNHVLSDRLH